MTPARSREVTPARPRALRRALDLFYTGCGVLAGISLVAIAVFVLIQIAARLFGVVVTWSAEFAGYAMAASSFLALAYTLNSGGHIRVDLILGRLPAGAKRWMEVLCLSMGMLIVGYFAWHCAVMTWQSFVFNEMGPGSIAVPLWIPQAFMALGVVALTVALADNLVRYLLWGTTGYPRDGSQPSTV